MECFVPEDDSVQLLSHQLEDLDYTKLYLAYSAKDRNPAVDPKIMFKILTYYCIRLAMVVYVCGDLCYTVLKTVLEDADMPRYMVALTNDEIQELNELVQKGGKGYRIKHAQIVLELDRKPENQKIKNGLMDESKMHTGLHIQKQKR